MPVVEYKHHINHMGKIEVPGWVADRGYWHNSADNTYLGWVKPASEREYYVPDGITELTKEECVTRVLAMHAANPMEDFDAADPTADPVAMTDAEVTTMVETWYDDIVANNT